jgi:hypothetical protein
MLKKLTQDDIYKAASLLAEADHTLHGQYDNQQLAALHEEIGDLVISINKIRL